MGVLFRVCTRLPLTPSPLDVTLTPEKSTERDIESRPSGRDASTTVVTRTNRCRDRCPDIQIIVGFVSHHVRGP